MTSSGWRPLRAADLSAVSSIAARVHPDFPEDDAVFADRLALAPEACFLFEREGEPSGYVLAHPFRRGALPALNSVLGTLPVAPDTLYIHDLALLAAARGTGAARAIVSALAGLARPHGAMSLVAVNGSAPFWTAMGFAIEPAPQLFSKLATYARDACYMVRHVLPQDAD